jgi:L-iditol 2-dehydrogenase
MERYGKTGKGHAMGNETAYLTGTETIRIRESEMPFVAADDVLVRIRHVTICGSDAHYFIDPTYGGKIVPPILPIILGHECAGVVEAVGEDVKLIKPGDLVALEPGAGCGRCEYCLNGRYNLCPDMDFMASPPFTRGALQRYVSHPAKMVFKLPETLDTVEGALMEPLSVGMYAARRAGVRFGDSCVVLGVGCIGLMTIAACRAMGSEQVIAVDLFDHRLRNALSMGATDAINASAEDVEARVDALTGGAGAAVVFETAGAASTAKLTIGLAKRGGRIAMVGNVYGETPFPFIEANNKEVDIVSVFRYVNMYPLAIEAVATGRIHTRDLISRTFPFERAQQAFECAVNEQDKVIKVLIEL